jgi:hypothetical protein
VVSASLGIRIVVVSVIETQLGEGTRRSKAACRYSRSGRVLSRGCDRGRRRRGYGGFRIDRNRDNVDGLNLALQTPEKQELEVRRMHRIQV